MKKTLLFLALLFTVFSASARVFSVRATLNGANVVPANASTGTGTFVGTFDNVTGLLSFTVSFSGLSSSVSTSRLYVGAAGINGAQIVSFGIIPSPFSASQTLNATQITDLLNGNVYFQIHTSSNPGGEIRGQIATIVEIFTSVDINDFYAIGGYSYTEGTFPAGVQANPYQRSGPLPNNDFSFAATSPGGITNYADKLRTTTPNQPISLNFAGNNIRKIRATIYEVNATDGTTGGSILATATTNLGNTATNLTTITNPTFGFRILSENEYITKIEFTAPPTANSFIAIDNIMIGDDSPQNVSLNFDGLNDFMSIPSIVGNFDFLDAFTVSCWVKPTADQPGGTLDVAILEKWDQTGPYPFVIRLLTSGADAGKVRVARYDGTYNPAFNSIITINDGKWHHIAFTSGGSGTVLGLYIDGVLQDVPTTDITIDNTTNSSPLFIGQRGNGINRFKGEIDEVRIWSIRKTEIEIQNEMFCKNPNTTNLQAAYNFNNGVPNGNNVLLNQIQDLVGTNHGILNNFAKTGDASNFVSGQVKYVKNDATGLNNGSSWANAFTDLQSALISTACNDLFEIYVAKGTGIYKPHANNVNATFTIPLGMKIYGGLAGSEKSINERNMALIHSTNQTTLSGDLVGNDTSFNFASGRDDNSFLVVKINGGYVTLDGITIRSGNLGIEKNVFGEININNCKIIDNHLGMYLNRVNSTLTNCIIAGNNTNGVFMVLNSTNFKNCLIVNNGSNGIHNINADTGSNFTNCTIASNVGDGIRNENASGSIINNIKNTIIIDNATGGIANIGIGQTNNITYSLVQGGISPGSGNLAPNTNPQFVNPLANTVISDTGNYRLKDSSPCINTGTDEGVSPLDLDRNPRPKGGKTDMGAYESNVNMNEIISVATGNWETPGTWNLDRIPLQTDKVIMNGHIVTVTTPNAKAKYVEQKPSSDLKFNTGGSLMLHQ